MLTFYSTIDPDFDWISFVRFLKSMSFADGENFACLYRTEKIGPKKDRKFCPKSTSCGHSEVKGRLLRKYLMWGSADYL
jgi:hypothetical protein